MPQFSENFCIINSHPHVAATWLAAHFRIPFYHVVLELTAFNLAGWHIPHVAGQYWIDADTYLSLAGGRLARYFCEPELSAVLKLLGGSLEEAA